MTKSEQFFYNNAGFSYDPKTETEEQGKERCAKDLARAEAYAKDHDWVFIWEMEQENPRDVFGEPDAENGPFYDPTNDFVSCVLRDSEPSCYDNHGRPTGGSVLASLGMIEESKDNRERENYRRVVEAELALEALAEIETEQRNAEACARLTVC